MLFEGSPQIFGLLFEVALVDRQIFVDVVDVLSDLLTRRSTFDSTPTFKSSLSLLKNSDSLSQVRFQSFLFDVIGCS
jgi:hypothetical protein